MNNTYYVHNSHSLENATIFLSLSLGQLLELCPYNVCTCLSLLISCSSCWSPRSYTLSVAQPRRLSSTSWNVPSFKASRTSYIFTPKKTIQVLCNTFSGYWNLSIPLDQTPSSCVVFFFISSYHIVNSLCCSHALVSGPTSKRPASDGGLCSGQLLMM